MIVHHRVNGQLAVSRSFGDVEHKGSAGPTTVVATPEVFVEPVSEADEFMVIATDGLWDVMASQEVVNFVRSRLSEHRDLARVAKELKEANKKLRRKKREDARHGTFALGPANALLRDADLPVAARVY